MTNASAFDALAADYDAHFSQSFLGALMREVVWRRLDLHFANGDQILELNCGTGEDALHVARRGVRVLATDRSAAMLEIACQKVEQAGLADLVHLHGLHIEELCDGEEINARLTLVGFQPPLDGAFSNFGGLNCVSDLTGVMRGLANLLRPKARVVVCIMGPFVPWEWCCFLFRGEPHKMLRRLRRGGAVWRGLTVRYPSVATMRRAVTPAFRVLRISALGALLPPTYLGEWAARHRRLVRWLDRWERRFENWPLVPSLSDHYLIELERR